MQLKKELDNLKKNPSKPLPKSIVRDKAIWTDILGMAGQVSSPDNMEKECYYCQKGHIKVECRKRMHDVKKKNAAPTVVLMAK
eukprot:338752-Pelagomonas_calceolata.AAC.1